MKTKVAKLFSHILLLVIFACDYDGFFSTTEFNKKSFDLEVIGNNAYVIEGEDPFQVQNVGAGITKNKKISKVDLTTSNKTLVAGSTTTGALDGVGAAASFTDIVDITSAGTPEKLYVADECAIREIDLDTNTVVTIAGTIGSCGDVDDTGLAASFATINGITSDGTDLYVTTSSNLVRKITLPSLVVTTIAGDPSPGDSDGIGLLAQFSAPKSLTYVAGSLFIFDGGNYKIRKLDLSTMEVTSIAGGVDGFADGIGSAARFGSYKGSYLSSDGSNFLFYTDKANHAVRSIDIMSGEVTTVIGGAGKLYDKDGTSAEFSIINPSGVFFTTSGLYIRNFFGIRRFR